mgnify:CR=1 FL=1|jgi:hypothetical protein
MQNKVLELFAGSRSIGKEAEKLGCEVFSVDIKQFGSISLIKDIEFLTIEDLPFIPDIGWGSPMCTTYSIAAISHHRDMGKPKTEFAAKSDRIILNVLKLYSDILKINPDFKWFLENPRGYLRKMYFMAGIPKSTVWYCKYGDTRAKPTDVWSNHIRSIFNPDGWQSRPMCFNGNTKCHHESAPRGSSTGTQGLKNNHERSKIPQQLCREIIISCL